MRRGATFIEMVIVMSIMMTIMAMAMFSGQFFQKLLVDYAAYGLEADLRFLQQEEMNISIHEQDGHALEHELKRIIFYNKIDINKHKKYAIYYGNYIYKKVELPGRVYVTCGTSLSFAYNGLITRADTGNHLITIHVTDGKNSRDVIVDRVGRIRVK